MGRRLLLVDRKEGLVMKLTDEDYSMLQYFWQEKGDVTRWSEWKEKKALFKVQHPELIDALNRYDSALRTLNIIVDNIGGE